MTKRTTKLHLEPLEDRTTPSTTLTVSFVPDGTAIGNGQSHLNLYQSTGGSAVPTNQAILSMMQTAASPYGLQLTLVADDGASMNGPQPQDGQLRVAAVDGSAQLDNAGYALPGGGDLIVESQVTFGVGLGLIGPGGPSGPIAGPATPAPNLAPVLPLPNTPPTATVPIILPFPSAFGNLYPTATGPTGPTGPVTGPSGPTSYSGPTSMTGPTSYSGPSGPTSYSGPTGVTGPTSFSGPSGPTSFSGPTSMTGPTSYSGPSGPTSFSGPTAPTVVTVSFVPDGTQIGNEQSQLFQDLDPVLSAAVWQQDILNALQVAASPYGVSVVVVADDGASLNATAPEDGQIRIAAVDQAFLQGAPAFALPGGGYLVAEVPATFGAGLGLIGPNGPLSPTPVHLPTGPTGPTGPAATLPLILPFQPAYGNLYPLGPTAPTGPTGPITGPTSISGPTSYSGPSGPTGMTGPTSFSGPSGPTYDGGSSGPTATSGPSGP